MSPLGKYYVGAAIASVILDVHLTEEDFYRERHRIIFRAIRQLSERGEPVDALTVTEYLTQLGELAEAGGREFVSSLATAVPVPGNAGHYAKIVKANSMLRRLLAVRRRATWLRDGEDEPGLWQRRRISPSRIRRVHAVIQSALSTAVKRRIITRNPAEHIELPPVPPRKPLVWTQARIAAWRRTGRRPAPVMIWPPEIAGEFLDRCEEDGERLIALYHLAVTRGLRRGDLWGLLWENVELDLAAGIGSIAIREDESTSYADEVDPEELISVKSAAGWRTIALDSQNVTLLARWRRQQAAERLAAGDAWEESGRVFTTPIGTPLRKDFIGDHFEVLVKRYGLPPIRFHDLRHCSASYMLASGADPKTVAATLGHGRASFTLDVYGSSLEELEQATAEAAVALIPRRHRVSGP